MISGVGRIIVPVDDQERAKQFWSTQLGFEVTKDESYGDERWVEVTPPDRSLTLVLSLRRADEPRREVSDPMLPHSDIFFTCDDVEATHRELAARGVRFAVDPVKLHFGWWSMFEDPDGTRYALGQWSQT